MLIKNVILKIAEVFINNNIALVKESENVTFTPSIASNGSWGKALLFKIYFKKFQIII